ncbi:unnamed protein product [Coregonus sp. 'balchen']|nr:unnamed protein product [Coregonus sp. 'balchen']
MFLAGTGNGCCGIGQRPGSSSGSCNPRKFSEKIALLTQRQAEDTAAFQEVMMDITSTRIQVQRVRQARSLGTYSGGSLPNVNQLGRSTSGVQGQLPCSPDNGCPTRLHPMAERAQGEGRLNFPTDNSPYCSVHLSPPLEPSWRRNLSSSSPVDKSHLMHPPFTALNRTNSDSALHTSMRNTHTGDQQALTSRNRHRVFPYPVPPIEENVLEEGKSLRNTKKLPALPTGIKSRKVPGINILSSPDQQFSALNVPSPLNVSGSLPNLSSLHLPSPQPVGVDSHKPTACSTDHLPGTPSHLGARDDEFPLPGLSLSLQGSYSNPLLQSFHSNPNIQSSLRSHSLSSSLNSTSLNLSLSNSSLQSSPSNQSLQSFLSSSSLSGLSLQCATSHCSYSSGIGGSRTCSSSSLSCSPRPTSQTQVPSSRRQTPLSPLVVPTGGESRWLQSKQFSPVGSPKLSSITQGVLLNTNQLPQESRPPGYHHCQPQHEGPPAAQQPMHGGLPQQQHSLTEGQQQPSQELKKTPLHQEKSRHQQQGAHQQQQQQDQQHPQQRLPQTHNLQQLQYHHRQPYQHPNQLYRCQIQHVQTEVPTMQMTRKHQTQAQGRSWAHQKVQGQKDQIESTKISSQMNSLMDNNPGLYNLEQLSKEPLWGDSGPQSVEVKDGGVYCGNQGPHISLHCQNQTSVDCHNNLMMDKAAYDDFSGVLPMLGFDADTFTLHNPLQIDPLDLEELNMLAGGDMVEDTVKGHCSNLLR